MNTTLTIVLAGYLLIILGISIYAGRFIKDKADYIVAGRRLPLWMAFGTLLATWFGAATMLGAAEAARTEGLSGTLLDPFAVGVALIVAGLFFAKPLWEMQLLTVGDFYARVYGRRAEVVASCVLIPGYAGWIGSQFVAIGKLQETFLGLSPQGGIVLGAGLILVFTLFGGMWSVTLTDTLQLAVLIVGVVILAGSVFADLGNGSVANGLHRMFTETDPAYLSFMPEVTGVAVLGLMATLGSGIFGCIPGQDLLQRVFASKDSFTAKRACLLAGVLYILFGLLPVGMGLASRLMDSANGDGAIIAILAKQFLSPVMTIVFVVSLMSMLISTATSAVLAPATILGHNLLNKLAAFQAKDLLAERIAVTIMVIGGVCFAFSGETILGLLEMALSIIFVGLFIPLVMGLYGKPKGELPGLLSMAMGATVWLARELMEMLVLPITETATKAGTSYADFIAQEYGTILFVIAIVPSSIWGIIASAAGYAIGQRLSAER